MVWGVIILMGLMIAAIIRAIQDFHWPNNPKWLEQCRKEKERKLEEERVNKRAEECWNEEVKKWKN